MPRRMMDYNMMMRDGRNPYGSRGGYVTSGRRGRRRGRDRGMDYEYDMAGRDYGDMARGDRAGDMGRGRDYGDYEGSDMARGGGRGRGRDRAGDYAEYGDMQRGGGQDGHYPMGQGSGYRPIEAMGYFTGYYGGEDYAGGDYGYDMARGGRGGNRGGRGGDRGYDYGDYGDYADDYGSTLSREELEEWKKKLTKEIEEKDKQFFSKETIGQKARQMGVEMKDFKEEELVIAALLAYTDYNKTIKKYAGNNMDIYIELGKDWLEDKDASVKGGEKLAVYYDCVVEGE